MEGMSQADAARVQDYMRRLFGNERIMIKHRPKDGSAEVLLGQEFIGVLFRDDEDDEVTYSFTMAILEEDLPPSPR